MALHCVVSDTGGVNGIGILSMVLRENELGHTVRIWPSSSHLVYHRYPWTTNPPTEADAKSIAPPMMSKQIPIVAFDESIQYSLLLI